MCNAKQKVWKQKAKKKDLCRAPKVNARQRGAFAKRLTEGARQRMMAGTPCSLRYLFAECEPLPSAWHLRKTFFAESEPLPSAWRSAKTFFAERRPLRRARRSAKKYLPSAIVAKGPALGKGGLCRALDE